MFRQTMVTTDGKPVLAGVFSFYETHGLPLDVVFGLIHERGAVVDWLDFYAGALRAGMKHDRIVARIGDAIADTFGPEVRDRVIESLERYGPHVRLKP